MLPGGAAALRGAEDTLTGAASSLPDAARHAAQEWLRDVDDGSHGVRASSVLTAVAASSTESALPPGVDRAEGGAGAEHSRSLLAAAFDDEEVRRLGAAARTALTTRLERLLDAEELRFLDRVDEVAPGLVVPAALRAAAAEADRFRPKAASTVVAAPVETPAAVAAAAAVGVPTYLEADTIEVHTIDDGETPDEGSTTDGEAPTGPAPRTTGRPPRAPTSRSRSRRSLRRRRRPERRRSPGGLGSPPPGPRPPSSPARRRTRPPSRSRTAPPVATRPAGTVSKRHPRGIPVLPARRRGPAKRARAGRGSDPPGEAAGAGGTDDRSTAGSEPGAPNEAGEEHDVPGAVRVGASAGRGTGRARSPRGATKEAST